MDGQKRQTGHSMSSQGEEVGGVETVLVLQKNP